MGICIYERNARINMRLQNELWMIKFLLKKKWIWVLTLTIGMYFVLLPYQQNLLDFFGKLDTAKILFWRSTYLYHNVFVLIFVFHAAVQLLNIELFELHLMWKVQIRFVLCGVFILLQPLFFIRKLPDLPVHEQTVIMTINLQKEKEHPLYDVVLPARHQECSTH